MFCLIQPDQMLNLPATCWRSEKGKQLIPVKMNTRRISQKV